MSGEITVTADAGCRDSSMMWNQNGWSWLMCVVCFAVPQNLSITNDGFPCAVLLISAQMWSSWVLHIWEFIQKQNRIFSIALQFPLHCAAFHWWNPPLLFYSEISALLSSWLLLSTVGVGSEIMSVSVVTMQVVTE